MSECSTSGQILKSAIFFLLIFLLHAVPMMCLFRRWRWRYYLGLLPATFCALGAASYFSFEVSCGLMLSQKLAILVSAFFYSICYLLFIFFKADLSNPKIGWGDAIIPFVLCIPLIGAIVATLWILFSVGRDRLLLDSGKEISTKDRMSETLVHVVMIIIAGALIILAEIN